jgi:hypothetical protein
VAPVNTLALALTRRCVQHEYGRGQTAAVPVFPAPLSPLTSTDWLRLDSHIALNAAAATANTCGGSGLCGAMYELEHSLPYSGSHLYGFTARQMLADFV